MGWLYTKGQTRKKLIEERVRSYKAVDLNRNETGVLLIPLKHCYRGGPGAGKLYIVWERKTPEDLVERFIEVDLLQYDNGLQGWGYKNMDCCMGPYVESCPKSYLMLSPPHDNDSCRT